MVCVGRLKWIVSGSNPGIRPAYQSLCARHVPPTRVWPFRPRGRHASAKCPSLQPSSNRMMSSSHQAQLDDVIRVNEGPHHPDYKFSSPKWDLTRPRAFFSSFFKPFRLGPTKSLNTLLKLYKYTYLLHFIYKKEKTKKTHAYFSHFSL